MDATRPTTAAIALALGAVSFALTSRVAAEPHDFFVVNTQFRPGQSRVVDASGLFAECDLVKDTESAATDDGAIRFTGEKRLSCRTGARVLLEYDVAFDPGTGGTTGTWHVAASTLEGVGAGDAGSLVGDPGGCTADRYPGGCILDRFTLAG